MATLSVGDNDLGTVNASLAAEWHPTKNGGLKPLDVTAGSNKKVWWLCSLQHEWEAQVNARSQGRGCPTCGGKRIITGFNDLSEINPELAAEWHPVKNGKLTPQEVVAGSHKRAWWLGKCAHEWEAKTSDRMRGTGCAFCAGKRVITGFNDLATINPDLVAEWHPTKNGELVPQEVIAGSHKKVWWECSLLHEWEATVDNRTNGNNCPFCTNFRVLSGFNDLATINPDLAAEWHPTKNGEINPQNIMPFSNIKAWWLGKCGHEWEATVDNRTNGNGCPFCSGNRILIGFNDLATTNPDLASEWHPVRNGKLTPQEVMAGSGKKAWWLGKCEHEWETVIVYRSSGNGCPKCCVGLTEKSFRETFEKLSGLWFDSTRISLIRLSRKFDRAQIDMLNDGLKLVIEYDGEWTHGARSPEGKTLGQKLAEDKETTQALVDIGYNVIRIRNHSRDAQLPLVPLDPDYESNVFQITYKSFGKDKDDIEELVQRIIEEKADWFEMPMKRMLAA